MQALALPFTSRFIVLTLCIAATAACAGIAMAQSAWLAPLSVPILLFGGFSLLGLSGDQRRIVLSPTLAAAFS